MTDQQLALSGAGRAAPPAIPEDAPPAIAQLLQTAVERGADVESLEKLVGLYERVEDRRAAQAHTAALMEFQRRCPPIVHDKTVGFETRREGTNVSYTYATLARICSVVDPVLHDVGLSYTWDSSVTETRMRVTCTLAHVGGHRQSATFEGPIDTRNTAMSGLQQGGGALSYGRRQSLIQVLGVVAAAADPDTDGAPASRISDNQLAELEDLLTATKADRPKFLAWLHVEKLGDLAVPVFPIAKQLLADRLAKQGPR